MPYYVNLVTKILMILEFSGYKLKVFEGLEGEDGN